MPAFKYKNKASKQSLIEQVAVDNLNIFELQSPLYETSSAFYLAVK